MSVFVSFNLKQAKIRSKKKWENSEQLLNILIVVNWEPAFLRCMKLHLKIKNKKFKIDLYGR